MGRPTRVVVAAWLLDRAEQYDNSSCCRAVFDELIHGVLRGEPEDAHAHGELDDVIERWRKGGVLRAAATRKKGGRR